MSRREPTPSSVSSHVEITHTWLADRIFATPRSVGGRTPCILELDPTPKTEQATGVDPAGLLLWPEDKDETEENHTSRRGRHKVRRTSRAVSV